MLDFNDMLRVGVITQTHGLKGEVKVFPTTDDVKRFDYLKSVYINTDSGLLELKVENARYFKQFVILKFEGIDDINDVEKYKKEDLYVSRKDAIPLEEGQYYIADIIGLKVIDEEGMDIGVVSDVYETGANSVYVVKGNENVDNKELMLPNIDECIKEVNLKENYIKVHIMKGLMDL